MRSVFSMSSLSSAGGRFATGESWSLIAITLKASLPFGKYVPFGKLLTVITTTMAAPMTDALSTARELLAHDTFERDCPTRGVLDTVTSRWGTLVIAALVEGPQRFAGLRDRVDGISEKMLSQTLRALTRSGLVDRVVELTRPPQVTYSLTPRGEELAIPLCSLIHWIGANREPLLESAARYDEEERVRRGEEEAEHERLEARRSHTQHR